MTIKAKFVQLLGNEVTDLLNPEKETGLNFGENKFGRVEIQGAEETEIKEPQ